MRNIIAYFFVAAIYILDTPLRIRKLLKLPIKSFDEFIYRIYH